MSAAKVITYAWKSVDGTAFGSENEAAYLQALQQVLDQVQKLPPATTLVTPIKVVDDGPTEDNDGSTVYVFHWEVIYAVPTEV